MCACVRVCKVSCQIQVTQAELDISDACVCECACVCWEQDSNALKHVLKECLKANTKSDCILLEIARELVAQRHKIASLCSASDAYVCPEMSARLVDKVPTACSQSLSNVS